MQGVEAADMSHMLFIYVARHTYLDIVGPKCGQAVHLLLHPCRQSEHPDKSRDAGPLAKVGQVRPAAPRRGIPVTPHDEEEGEAPVDLLCQGRGTQDILVPLDDGPGPGNHAAARDRFRKGGGVQFEWGQKVVPHGVELGPGAQGRLELQARFGLKWPLASRKVLVQLP